MDKNLILEWADKLKDSGKTVVVEGKKDARALNSFGVFKIFTLSKKPLYAVVEEIAAKSKEVVILTDFDKQGKALYGKLKSYFQRQGCEVDNYFREFLQKNFRFSHVEGIGFSKGLNL